MKFFKDNSYDVVKLFVNQIGITIFSLVLYTAVGFINDDILFSKIRVVVSVFAVLFYSVLIYTAAWDMGAKDIIMIDSSKMARIKAKGAKLSLIANLPNFIIAFLAVLFMLVYIGAGSEGCYTAFAICNLIMRFLNAMFLGLLQGIFFFLESNENIYFLWQSVGYLIMPFVSVGVAHFGYEMGARNIRIFPQNKTK